MRSKELDFFLIFERIDGGYRKNLRIDSREKINCRRYSLPEGILMQRSTEIVQSENELAAAGYQACMQTVSYCLRTEHGLNSNDCDDNGHAGKGRMI